MLFFAANVYGSQQLGDVFDSLPIPSDRKLKVVARFLDVTENTLSRWIKGKANPPRAVVYALWHESPAGLSNTCAHSEQASVYLRRLVNSSEQEVSRLSQVISALQSELADLKIANSTPLAMNEPIFQIH